MKWLYVFAFSMLFISNVHSDWWFTVQSLDQAILENQQLLYHPCSPQYNFKYQPFPLNFNFSLQPNSGYFQETFVAQISQAMVISENGFIFYQNKFIQDFLWKNRLHHLDWINQIDPEPISYIHGTVAVIAQPAYFNYCHWMNEVLGRLALLEMYGFSYDWLYVPQSHQFMIESLELWGIDRSKIINPTSPNFAIQTQHVLAPSLLSRLNFEIAWLCAVYFHPETTNYVRSKLLNNALRQTPSISLPSKKIFLSRKDSNIRQISNEDDLFSNLEQQGFHRYTLSSMPLVDQIHLFHNAEIIVAPHGAGLTNILFCKPNTKIIELFQDHLDCTFCYMSQELHLDYTAISTNASCMSNDQNSHNAKRTINVETINLIASTIQAQANKEIS